jgi:hypothetical protein
LSQASWIKSKPARLEQQDLDLVGKASIVLIRSVILEKRRNIMHTVNQEGEEEKVMPVEEMAVKTKQPTLHQENGSWLCRTM